MTETHAEQEGDRRVVAAVAALVLLVLVVAGIVAAAAMAYRDDGKGDLLGTKQTSFDWPATAPGVRGQASDGGLDQRVTDERRGDL